VTDPRTAGPSTVMTGDITRSFTSLWTRYSGVQPSDVRTELRGDVVTCVLVNAVEAFEGRTTDRRSRDVTRGTADLTLAGYKLEAVETVVRLTRQRVASFLSSHDRDTNVATEIFTLEPPPRTRGRPSRARDVHPPLRPTRAAARAASIT
jgi:Na+-translocating membrane potential-generating system (MpsC)